MSALETFTGELAAVARVAADLGSSLLVSQAAERVGIVGASQLRQDIERVLSGPAENPPCGCHAERRSPCGCRAENPPKLSLRALAGEARIIARDAARDLMRKSRSVSAFKLALTTAALATPLIVWDVLVPDEAVEVSRVFTESAVMREQLNRLPPEDAVKLYREMSTLYGTGGGSSLVTWLVIGGITLLVGPPLIKRALQ